MCRILALAICLLAGAVPPPAVAYPDPSSVFGLQADPMVSLSDEDSISQVHIEKVPPPKWENIKRQLIDKLTAFVNSKEVLEKFKKSMSGEYVQKNKQEVTEEVEDLFDPFFRDYAKIIEAKEVNSVVALLALHQLIVDRVGNNDDTPENRLILAVRDWVSTNALKDVQELEKRRKLSKGS